jgi:predicted small secreted protein
LTFAPHREEKMNKTERKTTIALTFCAVIALLSVLSACHTTAGAGEDISDTGQAIEHSADKHTP